MALPSSVWVAAIRGCSMRMSGTTTARWRSNSIVSMVTVSRSAMARGGSCAKPSGLAICTPSATATVCLPSRSPKCCSVTGRPSAAEASRAISGRNQSQSHTATNTPMATTTPPSTKGQRRRRSRRLCWGSGCADLSESASLSRRASVHAAVLGVGHGGERRKRGEGKGGVPSSSVSPSRLERSLSSRSATPASSSVHWWCLGPLLSARMARC